MRTKRAPPLDTAAEAYRRIVYVKSYVRRWGYVPIRKLRPILLPAGHTTSATRTARPLPSDHYAPAPRGWVRGYEVHCDHSAKPDWVRAEDLAVPRGVATATVSFDTAHPEKNLRNLTWARLCLEQRARLPSTARQAVVLDGSSLNTSTLSTHLHLFQHIHVPNFDTQFEAQRSTPWPQGVTYHPMSLYEFFISRDHPADGYDLALDYCCTWWGSANLVQPQADLSHVFAHGLLARHHGVLWLTFSTRGCHSESTTSLLAAIQHFVQQQAHTHRYVMELCEQGSYISHKTPMVYLFFRSLVLDQPNTKSLNCRT